MSEQYVIDPQKMREASEQLKELNNNGWQEELIVAAEEEQRKLDQIPQETLQNLSGQLSSILNEYMPNPQYSNELNAMFEDALSQKSAENEEKVERQR